MGCTMIKKIVLISVIATLTAGVYANNFNGAIDLMAGIKPESGKVPAYDSPNTLILNDHIGQWTYSLTGLMEFQGLMSTHAATNGLTWKGNRGDYNAIQNTWGGQVAYDFLNGYTASVNLSYINWKNTDNNPSNYVYPILVTGYQFTPMVTYTSGVNSYSANLICQVVGSNDSIAEVSYTGEAPVTPSGNILNPWNGQKGEFLQFTPQYSYKGIENWTISSNMVIMQANDNYILLSQAVNNENNNEIELNPLMLNYKVESIPGLSLKLDTRYYYYNTVQNDPVQATQATVGSTKLSLLPGFSYSHPINSNCVWNLECEVYGKWYTNNLNGQLAVNKTSKYGADLYTGISYLF